MKINFSRDKTKSITHRHLSLQSRQLINGIYFYGYCLSLLTLIISLIIFLCFRWDLRMIKNYWVINIFFLLFKITQMHENKNSHSAFYFTCTKLHFLDSLVSDGCSIFKCHRWKSTMVHSTSHSHAILDDL